jgi:hypothetical protein
MPAVASSQGSTIIIVEQNVHAALGLAHRCYVLNNGHMVFEGTPDALRREEDFMHRHLGVSNTGTQYSLVLPPRGWAPGDLFCAEAWVAAAALIDRVFIDPKFRPFRFLLGTKAVPNNHALDAPVVAAPPRHEAW